MKVVINRCFGGFGLSDAAIKRYGELAGLNLISKKGGLFGIDWYVDFVDDNNFFFDDNIPRDDPNLVRVVEEMGEESWGSYSELAVVEIPDDAKWTIDSYDGNECVAECHRTWC